MGIKGQMVRHTSISSGHFSGKSCSATTATESAIWALRALLVGAERAIIAGTNCERTIVLSFGVIGASSES